VIPVTVDTVRLFLHVLGATVWVGGQITLLGLLPTVRELGEDAPKAVARRFNLVAWPAFALLVVTGVWNLLEVDLGDTTTAYQVTLAVKLVAVAASGIGAAVHVFAKDRLGLAIGGAVGFLGALVATFLGVLLAG
jgi:putative copper export protein